MCHQRKFNLRHSELNVLATIPVELIHHSGFHRILLGFRLVME